MSGIENTKRAMDWMHPNDRQSCGNCAKVKVEKFSSHAGKWTIFRCTPGGFITPRHALCGEYVPQADGNAPK